MTRSRGFRGISSYAVVAVVSAALTVLAGAQASRARAAEAPSTPPIVFASRVIYVVPEPDERGHAFELATAGRLLVWREAASLQVLVDSSRAGAAGEPGDIADPDVSFDGERIVFAGYSPTDGAWRIFEVRADGSGLRQITHSDRQMDLSRYGAAADLFRSYDDGDPCYLPDGRICFVSTRYPGVAPDGRRRTTNLYVVGADGSDLHRITTERFGADTPAVEPSTGRIVYSRWWRTAEAVTDPGMDPDPVPPGSPGYEDIAVDVSEVVLRGISLADFPGVNNWFLAGINPDGTDISMWAGFRIDRARTQAYRPSFLEGGGALALFIPRTPFINVPRGNGLRLFARGPGLPEILGGPQSFPRPETDPPPPPVAPPEVKYASAAALPDGRLVVSANLVSFEPARYGLYLQASAGAPLVLLHDDPFAAELDAVPLVSRPLPPVVADRNRSTLVEEAPRTVEEAFAQGGSFTFKVENIHSNAPVGVPIVNAPPIGNRLSIEFYMNPQRTSTTASDAPILIRTEPIPKDGKIEVTLPAGVPLFEILKTASDQIPVGRDGQIFHVGGMNFGRAGETARCVGCHAGHSQMPIPDEPAWTNLAPSAFVRVSSQRVPPFPESPVRMFRKVNLVDRTLDPRTSEWAAQDSPQAEATLQWPTSIRSREVLIYGTAPGEGENGPRNQVIRAATLATYLKGVEVQTIRIAGEIVPAGTHVALDPAVEFDQLTVTIRTEDVQGLYEGSPGPALAEIEVIAQVTGEPGQVFLRGDTDQNGALQLTDGVFILGRLFLGSRTPPCEAATDINGDGTVNISDPTYLFGFLFLGGSFPPHPFPTCGTAPEMDLTCEASFCR